MTAGPKTFNGQLIELAGGVNIFADVAEDYPQINDEEVITRNPAVIMGADTMGEKLTTELVAQRPGWDQIDAVRNGRIYLFNGDMVARAGPRLALVLEEMAKAMYPELFE
jgi:iron complex transport system substrate-binding protein